MHIPDSPEVDDTFRAAVALVRAGVLEDEDGMRVIVESTDHEQLLLATGALAVILGRFACGSREALLTRLQGFLTEPTSDI